MGNKKVTLTIEGIDQVDKKTSTKIPYINPNISDAVMKTFAQKCAALSDDTHTGTIKTVEEDITNAATKPKLTLTLANDAKSALMFSRSSDGSYLFSGTTLPAFTYKLEAANTTILDSYFVNFFQSNDRIRFGAHTTISSTTTETVTATVYFEETDTTAATTAQIVISYDAQPVLTIL